MTRILTHYRNDLAAFGSCVYPPGGTYRVDRQTCYQLVFIHSGSAALTSAAGHHFIKSGYGFLMIPGMEYGIAFSPTRNTHHTWINYYRVSYSDRMRDMLLSRPPGIPMCAGMQAAVSALTAFSQEQEPAVNMAFTLQASVALELFMARVRQQCGTEEQPHEAVRLAQGYIMEHLSDPVRLAGIAEAAHVAPEYLVRLFKAAGETSPVGYLWRKRVDMAVELLRSSGLDMQEIARQCGFSNPYHFSRKIKEVTGMSPRGHRGQKW